MIICDDALFSLGGKTNISGMYSHDVIIPTRQQQIAQLVFLFTILTSKEEPLKALTLKITFPGSEPVNFPGNLTGVPCRIPDDRKTIVYQQSVLVPLPILRPGKIIASVVHEAGEIEAGSLWVSTLEDEQRWTKAKR
ncbi:MAG: hypothetical protein FWD68_06135 [Alphaproteobacteria bacterium]|nr:hypothetical protein [Alphaproteobacteria bacterium]